MFADDRGGRGESSWKAREMEKRWSGTGRASSVEECKRNINDIADYGPRERSLAEESVVRGITSVGTVDSDTSSIPGCLHLIIINSLTCQSLSNTGKNAG